MNRESFNVAPGAPLVLPCVEPRWAALAALSMCSLIRPAQAQVVIERSTFSCGGAVQAIGDVQLSGTVAQSVVAAPTQSGNTLLAHGFWSASTPPCPADLNGDRLVNTADLTRFLGQFGKTCGQVIAPCADFNNDSVINTSDLTFFLGRFGNPCPM